MKKNIFWSVYKQIEFDFENVLSNIHLDDKQFDVYSSKIASLLLATCSEIESISKELYLLNNGKKNDRNKIFYDHDALKLLNRLFLIEKKEIYISSRNCYLKNRYLKPFEKNTLKNDSGEEKTFKWNHAYQNIKHDKIENLKLGNFENLITAIGALYLLNIYFQDNNLYVGKDQHLTNVDLSFNSSLFNVTVHKEPEITIQSEYLRGKNFHDCVYLLVPDSTLIKIQKEKMKNLGAENKLTLDNISENIVKNNLKGILDLRKATFELKYSLKLNKNQKIIYEDIFQPI